MKVYRNALDAYLIPAFGPTRLDSIRPRDLAAFVRDATTRPQGKHDRPLSGKFVNLLLNVTHAIYDKALGEELVQANPVVASSGRRCNGSGGECSSPWRLPAC